MEIKLDSNPYLLSTAGKKRKKEIIEEFLLISEKMQIHSLNCSVPTLGEGECEICKKFLLMVNILLQEEQKRNCGKLDVKEMVKKGIVETMVFGDGIKFGNI